MNDPMRRILVGRIHGAFGVRGELKLESLTEPAGNLLRYQP
jgi:16S rRNA processing protein RimM